MAFDDAPALALIHDTTEKALCYYVPPTVEENQSEGISGSVGIFVIIDDLHGSLHRQVLATAISLVLPVSRGKSLKGSTKGPCRLVAAVLYWAATMLRHACGGMQ